MTLNKMKKKRAFELEKLKMKQKVEKEKAKVGNMLKDAPKQVWGAFEKVLNRKERMRRQYVEKICAV